MRRAVWMMAIALGVAAFGAGAWAQTSNESATPWLHLRVSERGDESATVNVNLPLTAVEAVAALMPERLMSRGRMRLHRAGELSVSDLRALWGAVRETEDGEFVSIDRDDGRLRVARAGDVIQVRFEGRRDDDDADDADDAEAEDRSVRVEIPVAVVDALLSGDDDSLNLVGAIEQLKDRRGDIVRITDGDERVHIWIDERQSG